MTRAPMSASDSDDEGAWIDRTNHADTVIADGYSLPADLTDLCLTNNRLKNLDGLDGVPNLRRLILRQNMLTAVPPLGAFPELREVDFYINALVEVAPDAFVGCTKLRKVDLSFNDLRSINKVPVADLPVVRELFLISNKIKVMENLHSMPLLTFLELGDNRIRNIDCMDQLPSLTSLWLGRNKIERIERLDNLPRIEILSLQSNRITKIENLNHLSTLTELYLSHNGITVIEGLECLVSLSVLDLSANQIEVAQGLSTLVNLVEFWANDNKLADLDALAAELAGASGLETVYLEGNPLAKEPNYEERALAALPSNLSQLDALPVEQVRQQIAKKEAEAPAKVEEVDAGEGANG